MASRCPRCDAPVPGASQRLCPSCGHDFEISGEAPERKLAGSSPSEDGALLAPTRPSMALKPAVEKAAQEATDAFATEDADSQTRGLDPATDSAAILKIALPTGDMVERDLGDGETRIGKGPRNDIVIPDPSVSTSHATISAAGGVFTIVDLGSRNGTFVNGERVNGPHPLNDGDVVQLGLTKVTFLQTRYSNTLVLGDEQAKLIGVSVTGEKIEHLIGGREVRIGKAAHNQIILDDPTVSNTHAILSARDDGYWIVDLGSRNGTSINGERLGDQARPLHHGDTIQVGKTTLTFRNPLESNANTTAVLIADPPADAEATPPKSAFSAPPPGRETGAEPVIASFSIEAAKPLPPGDNEISPDLTAESSAPQLPEPEAAQGAAEVEKINKKKKKKKKKEKDERLRAAYIGALGRVIAAIIGVTLTVLLALYIGRTNSTSTKPEIAPSKKGKAKLKFGKPESGTPFEGGAYQASGVVQVPGTNSVLFVDNGRPGQVLSMQLDQSGRQAGPIKAVDLGVSIADPEGIAYGASLYYIVGSQARPATQERNSLVRFAFDGAGQRVQGKPESMTGLRDFLISNVPELRDAGDLKGGEGGLDIEGIAWDGPNDRLLLGLRSPVVGGKALVVPLKLRDPRGPFSIDNVIPPGAALQVSLGGLGIRDLQYDVRSNSFLLVAGAPSRGEAATFSLWEWGGEPSADSESAAREIAKLDAKMKPAGVARVKFGGQDFVLIVGAGGSYAKLDYPEDQ